MYIVPALRLITDLKIQDDLLMNLYPNNYKKDAE
jgi:hypothetical protein